MYAKHKKLLVAVAEAKVVGQDEALRHQTAIEGVTLIVTSKYFQQLDINLQCLPR